jgi:Holliday junction resolvase RusA-like endonuclease
MREIAFTIPGKIGGKQRAGREIVWRHNAKPVIRSFNPHKTESQEAVVRQIAALEMRGHALLRGPLRLDVVITRLYPKSWSAKKRARSGGYVATKPDYDNQLKLLGDAMQGIVMSNDAAFATGSWSRFYDEKGPERVFVRVAELTGDAC